MEEQSDASLALSPARASALPALTRPTAASADLVRLVLMKQESSPLEEGFFFCKALKEAARVAGTALPWGTGGGEPSAEERFRRSAIPKRRVRY
jgi:hypothetical protein